MTDFVDAVERAGMFPLAKQPFDLKALIRKWREDGVLGSRFEVLERLIELQLQPSSSRVGELRLDPTTARAGARVLAGAVTLTGSTLICLPNGNHGLNRIDPRVLLPHWSHGKIDALLRTGLFDDVVFTSVRFRHREIRELLSAEWLRGLLDTPGERPRVEDLFFRERYGEQVLVPRMRSTLAWLILLDQEIREKALALAPEIASEGGDPSRLPLNVRMGMLRDIVANIATRRE